MSIHEKNNQHHLFYNVLATLKRKMLKQFWYNYSLNFQNSVQKENDGMAV